MLARMKQFLLGLSVSFAFVIGCVTATALTSEAQAVAPAEAPTTGAVECMGVTTNIGDAEGRGAPTPVRMPAGWSPVGGSSYAGRSAVVILCRNLGVGT